MNATADVGYHAFVDDGTGRCSWRERQGHWPACGQWRTNDVHQRREPAWVTRMREGRLPPKEYR